MRKIESLSFSATILLIAASSCCVLIGQTSRSQRGVQDATPAPPSVPAAVGPYYALIIGNNDYQHVNKLETAVNDAREVAQVLRQRYGFETTIIFNGTRSQILTALDDYRQLPEKSNLLIYYAGHGHKDVAAHRAYWLPVDAEKDHTPNWINAVEITDAIRAIPSLHVLVIADSCFSGDLTMRSAGARISPGEHNVLLSKALRMKSRHIMSSGGDEPVADDGTDSHSVFAAALLKSLDDIEPDAFTAEELLYQWVKPRVAGRSAQTPQYAILRETDADLGDFVFFRLSKANDKAVLPAAKAHYTAKQYEKALPLFRQAADRGNGEAANFLGVMYENGYGLPKDAVQAVTWYRKAADAGDPDGMNNLGGAYSAGQGGAPKDEIQAVSWYRKAADAGSADGMDSLGRAYAIGFGGLPKDTVQAVSWYRKAVEAGSAIGMYDLGGAYATGFGGLPKDAVRAGSLLRKAAEAGLPEAMNDLGNAYLGGRFGLSRDLGQAISWFRKAADAGSADGMYNLVPFYMGWILPPDDVQVVSLYRKAAEAGHAAAMGNLGAMYRDGSHGLPKDEVQAGIWFLKAAEAGDTSSMISLGEMYEAGRGGLPQSQSLAIGWYRKAVDAGNPYAKDKLAPLQK